MTKKTIYILTGILAVLIIIALVVKNKFSDRNTLKVAVEKVGARNIVETVTGNGKIYPIQEVNLSVEVPGEVVRIYVEEGDSVQKGDILLEVNPTNFISSVSRSDAGYKQGLANLASAKARLAQAEAQYSVVALDYERRKKLFDQEVISSTEFETAQSNYYAAVGEKEAAEQNVEASRFQVESALATLQESKENLARTKLYAPNEGIVSKLAVSVGEKVVGTAQMAGTQLLTIANLDQMQLNVDVGENDVLRISVGDTAEIEVDAYLGEKFKGVVNHIAYSSNVAVDQQVTKFQVQILLLKESYKHLINAAKGHAYPFRPGMSATADIITNRKENIIAVPIQSVTLREKKNESTQFEEKKQVVFIVKESVVHEIEVKTGIQDDKYIEILEGLSKDESVVIAPFRAISKELKDKQNVSVVEEENLFETK